MIIQKGMRNCKCTGMNGERHLPEARAVFAVVCSPSPPSHPLTTEGERERRRVAAEGRHCQLQRHASEPSHSLTLPPQLIRACMRSNPLNNVPLFANKSYFK